MVNTIQLKHFNGSERGDPPYIFPTAELIWDYTRKSLRIGDGVNIWSNLTEFPTESNGSSGGGDTVKISSDDTTSGYLGEKLIAGTGITLTESDEDGSEIITISSTSGGGSSSWNEIYIGEEGVYATPTNTSTIHTYVSYVGKIYPGMGLKYNIGGTFYYAVITAVTDVGIVIAGAPLSGSILELYHADANRNAHVDFFINGVFNSVVEGNMIRTYNKTRFRWQLSEARLVRISHCSDLIDSGANQPCINVKVNGVKVCTSNSNDGRALRNNIWTDSEVDINTSAYVVKYGDEIEVTTTVGGTGDAECLTVSGVLVLI